MRRTRQAPPPDDKYRRVVERTVAMLRAYAKVGGNTVLIEEVLDLLGQDPDTAPPVPVQDPRADPLTGCLPVTADRSAAAGTASNRRTG